MNRILDNHRTGIAAFGLVSVLAACSGGVEADSGGVRITDDPPIVTATPAVTASPAAGAGRDRLDPATGTVVSLPDGMWEMAGYGTILDVDGGEIEMRYVTSSTCFSGETIDNELAVDHIDDDGAVITVDLVGPTTDYRLVPLQSIGDCDASPSDALTALDELFRAHYPFFAERGVDWETEFTAMRDAVGDGMSLADAFAAFAVDLGDGHTTPEDVDIDIHPSRFDDDLDPAADLGAVIDDEIERTLERVDALEFDSTGTVGWGRIDDSIGYLIIAGFSDLTADDDPVAQREALDDALAEAIRRLDGTERLIVDMRFNPGGYEDLAVVAAGHFATAPTEAYRKWAYAAGDPIVQTVEVTPAAEPYDGHVAVLVSPVTASAAEVFLLAIDAVADPTFVGRRSAGEYSDAIDWVLPDGTEFTLSMEVYTDLDGVGYEAVGMPVDIEVAFDETLEAAIAAMAADS